MHFYVFVVNHVSLKNFMWSKSKSNEFPNENKSLNEIETANTFD